MKKKPELIRPVLWVSQDQHPRLFAADATCSGCATPCRSVPSKTPANAVPGDTDATVQRTKSVSIRVLRRALILLGGLIWSLEAVASAVAAPLMLVAGVIGACAIGAMVAKRTLPEVDRALKASGVVPTIKRSQTACQRKGCLPDSWECPVRGTRLKTNRRRSAPWVQPVLLRLIQRQ